jgi:hypothetical protein
MFSYARCVLVLLYISMQENGYSSALQCRRDPVVAGTVLRIHIFVKVGIIVLFILCESSYYIHLVVFRTISVYLEYQINVDIL